MCNVLFIKDLPPPTRKFKNRWLSTGLNQINKCKNYLKIILLIFLITGFGYNVNAQKNTEERKQLFEKEMNAYITTHLNEEIAEIKQNTDLIENFDEYTEEDIRSMAKENAKDKYIRSNMKEYLNTYFSNPQAMVITDTFVCDNGGFEDDFQYYSGFISSWYLGTGGSVCNPGYIDKVSSDTIPVVYTPVPIPYDNRFEIVGTGYDSAFGIKQVKFGNKAARINNKLGPNDACSYSAQIDRLVKRFKVTNETKDFTIWYAVALQNPSGHTDRQPFFNISCDRDPEHELCFDANFLKCIDNYSDENCYYGNVKLLDWSCHTFKIPSEFIDSIATLTITVADCAKGAHFGVAYIDGICEPCDSSALGAASLNTVDYISCEEDTPPRIATVCGKFTLPTISSNCNNNPDTWEAIDIIVPGYEIENLQIYSNNTFCFDFPETNFDGEDCLDIYVEIYFSNGTDTLPPQLSNSLEICQSKYKVVDCNGGGGPPIDTCDVVVDIQVGACQSNGTGGDNDDDQTPNMSDDYYYVYVSLYDPGELGWSIDRDLVDPYPNENDVFTIADGIGDTVSMILGPFLIQEGDWWMEFYLPGCNFSEYVEAPDYCSGCEEFRDAEIGNVTCISNPPPNDDTWSFTLKVPNQNSPFNNPLYFHLYNAGTYVGPFKYNDTHTIPNLDMGSGCKVFTMKDENNLQCISSFTICPPKPCNDECIDFNVHVEEMECIFDERSQQYTGYEVLVDISGIDESEQKVCVSYVFASDPNQTPIQWGSLSNGLWTVGPFDSDIYLTFSVCPKNENCPCSSTTCFKTIYIPKPDCVAQKGIENREQKNESEEKNVFENNQGDLLVIPNPFNSNEVFLQSTLKRTKFEIYDLSGRMIQHGEFEGEKHRISFNELPGIYFIKYVNKIGKPAFVKMIKL